MEVDVILSIPVILTGKLNVTFPVPPAGDTLICPPIPLICLTPLLVIVGLVTEPVNKIPAP